MRDDHPFTASGALDLDGSQRLVPSGRRGLRRPGAVRHDRGVPDDDGRGEAVPDHGRAGGRRRPRHADRRRRHPDTAHTLTLAREAERAGADALLLVAPYYSRPPQDAVEAYFRETADATDLPVVLYDIPARTGVRVEPDTLLRLAGHPRIVAVKDCSGDFLAAQKVMARTDLAYYAGCDEHNLALRAVGGAGCVSTVANVAPSAVRRVLDAFDKGDTGEATRLQHRLTPLIEAVMASGLPGTVTAKALLPTLGLPAGPVRPPLRPADPSTTAALREAYARLTADVSSTPDGR